MILSDGTLLRRLSEFIGDEWADPTLVNPASIDIRVGTTIVDPEGNRVTDISDRTANYPWDLYPKCFLLVSTLERLRVPLDCAVEFKLKSSRAREGYNHSLAFWFDPGWDGIGTMELTNLLWSKPLPLYPGLRIGQIIVHQLDAPAKRPYAGRYNGAVVAEAAKAGN